MKKQKICIIGGGLTGLLTAITLGRLNVQIDLITSNNINTKSIRTTAISESNYNFLKSLKISRFKKINFWPCSEMKIYTEKKEKFNEIFELTNSKNKNKQILYMSENSKIMKNMVETIKKNKLISFKTQKNISGIKSSGLLKKVVSNNKNSSKYNLIIVCTGNNSNLVKIFFNDQSLNLSYEEISITTIIKHDPLKNRIARQLFLNREILALLPISNTKTSIVWSLKKKEANYYKNKLLIKKQIKFYTKNFLKNIKFISGIEFRDLNLLIRKKYFYERILIFGDALHAVHPLAGQGFNMTIRDLINLEKTLKNKISLGLDIGGSDVLSEFSNTAKPRNFAYSIGIDFIKKFFSKDKEGLKNKIIAKLNKNNFVKNLFFDVADKGLKF